MRPRLALILRWSSFGLVLLAAVFPWKIVTWEGTTLGGGHEEGTCFGGLFYKTSNTCQMRDHATGSWTGLGTCALAAALLVPAFRRAEHTSKSKGTSGFRLKAASTVALTVASAIVVTVAALFTIHLFSTGPSTPDAPRKPGTSYSTFSQSYYEGPGGFLLPLAFALPLVATFTGGRREAVDPFHSPSRASGTPSYRQFRG